MRRLLWAVFLLASLTAIVVVAIPTMYIQPFKPQTADWLARAYALRRAAPAVTAIALPVAVLSAIALVWMGTLRPRRRGDARSAEVRRHVWRFGPPAFRGVALIALVGLTGLVTWFCRQNHFEWMFAPPAEVKYVSARDASRFLTGDEMVIGIEVAGLSLAYPVRQMAYHHVVNDMVGTTPVVVTY